LQSVFLKDFCDGLKLKTLLLKFVYNFISYTVVYSFYSPVLCLLFYSLYSPVLCFLLQTATCGWKYAVATLGFLGTYGLFTIATTQWRFVFQLIPYIYSVDG